MALETNVRLILTALKVHFVMQHHSVLWFSNQEQTVQRILSVDLQLHVQTLMELSNVLSTLPFQLEPLCHQDLQDNFVKPDILQFHKTHLFIPANGVQ